MDCGGEKHELVASADLSAIHYERKACTHVGAHKATLRFPYVIRWFAFRLYHRPIVI